jgi:hypothetical protein
MQEALKKALAEDPTRVTTLEDRVDKTTQPLAKPAKQLGKRYALHKVADTKLKALGTQNETQLAHLKPWTTQSRTLRQV